jgi:hypothetical protein
MPIRFGLLSQPASCIKEEQQMSTTAVPDRFTTLPDENSYQELPGRIHIVLIRQAVGF